MEFESDNLELQRIAGGNITKYPPIFSDNASFLFVRYGTIIQVYSTGTGELTQELTDANSELISMELEPKQPDILIACTVDGELLRWHWLTGVLQKIIKLDLPRVGPVVSFNLLNMYRETDTACAFIITRSQTKKPINWGFLDTTTGKRIMVRNFNLFLKTQIPIVCVGMNENKYIIIAQSFYVYVVNYADWNYVRYKNAHKVPITCACFNPVEEMFATGDETGKVFLWRQFNKQKLMQNTLYHWHHTAVTSIAFTASGTSFYSSGHEAVLVKWNITHMNLRNFLPRMSSIIRHIVVSRNNEHVVVCTDDNSLQFIGASDNMLKTTVQNFTYAVDDKTRRSKFPIGLLLNPRSNTLVLNGRMGYLQFYSTYTNNLLYNLAIVDQNKLSMESGQILFNTCVTKAAFNINWMATGEVFNDEQHLPELTLKFWKYNQKLQKYELNTSIDLPHEGGFKAIAFSNDYKVDHLLCATVGEDHIIKMWALENSESIYCKRKIWSCIAQTTYKQLPVESVSFSEDGSLLAAGYGNTLCIFKADTLKLKAALSGSSGTDGVLAKVQFRLSTKKLNGARNEYIEQRKKLWQQFKYVLEMNDTKLIAEIKSASSGNQHLKSIKTNNLMDKTKEQIFTKIREMHELNLHQKLKLFQHFGIQCQVHEESQKKFANYMANCIAENSIRLRIHSLYEKLHRVNIRERYKAKYRLQRYSKRKSIYDDQIIHQLVPLLSLMNLSANTKEKEKVSTIESNMESQTMLPEDKILMPPVQTRAQIKHVQFAAVEYAHLVVVCTDNRLLIWNLLTLRIQSVFKLSVRHLAFDRRTNLLAAFTINNELHVFQPNVPLPLYQRVNLPNMYGLIWLPLRQSKKRSINVDWQAQSTLYFLSEQQEIVCLSSSKAVDTDVATKNPKIPFRNHANPESFHYATFGIFAANKTSEKQTGIDNQSGPLIVGKGKDAAIRTLVGLSTHTMAPLNLLCHDFIKSLLSPAETLTSEGKTVSKVNQINGNVPQINGNDLYAVDTDFEDDPSQTENILLTEVRKSLLKKVEAQVETAHTQDLEVESKLASIADQSFEFTF